VTLKIFDISLTISADLPVWPGDPAVELNQIASINEGAQANVSHLQMSVHSGTHIDAPHHFLNDGRTVEKISLDVLIGPCCVVQLPDEVKKVNAEVLQGLTLPKGTTRLLLRTSNSNQWKNHEGSFTEDFVAISSDGAQWLAEQGAQLVGVDYLSVAPFGESLLTHTILLEAGVVLLEGLDLSAVPPGSYDLYCLPLKLLGADGAPARAILIQTK
jgi:arylformamidase